MAKSKYLECGRAVSTHGVRGTLRLESYCNDPETLAKLRTLYVKTAVGYEPYKVRAASVQKNMVLCTFEKITTLNDAITYKGTVFYADRADLKLSGDEKFVADILGLDVIDFESGEKYGTLADVITPAGREVYVVSDVCGGQFMIPVVPDFVRKIVDEGEDAGVYVTLIDGMRDIG